MFKLTSMLASLCFASALARGADLYVSPSGADTNSGTADSPFATPAHAVSAARAGDRILLQPGTYKLDQTLHLSRSGTADAPLSLLAATDKETILDFAAVPDGKNSRGIQLNGDHWHLKGLTIQHAPDNGINVLGSNNVIEQVVTRWNQDTGLQMAGSASRHPSDNLVLNVDSYENYDPKTRGENADGFAAKFRQLGERNTFRACRSWGNADDGYDFWAAAHGVTLEGCWAFKNGNDIGKLGDRFAGDGNGFKLGQDSGQHVLKNCLAWDNPGNGFDVNGNARHSVKANDPLPHGVTLIGNASFRNGRNFSFPEPFPHALFNNISLASKTPDAFAKELQAAGNSWNDGAPAIAEADFVSIDPADVTAARAADGSLPAPTFLKLKSDSASRTFQTIPVPTVTFPTTQLADPKHPK